MPEIKLKLILQLNLQWENITLKEETIVFV